MLDILRKHASSWAIKVPIAAIIISFAFFFGYSAMRRGGQDDDGIVAMVNGNPVSAAEYKYFLDNNYENLRRSFKGSDLPDFVIKMARSTTMQQVVAREIMLQETNDLGIVVPDNEIADIIKDVQTRMQGGQFDLAFYRQRFLPHFKNRYGLDYEKFVKQDLRLESFQNLFDEVDKAPLLSPESELAQNDTWIFETIEIEPNKLVEEKIIENKDNAEAIAVEIINIPPKKWKRKLAELKLESQKTGAITISERGKLAGGKLPFDKLKAIFKLTKDNPVLDKPIKHEDRLYIVRLVEISKGKDKAEKPTGTDPFFRMWMSKLLAKAKVESYVGGEEQ